jgi:glycosyltransferase involved in cell wall biosynthesis
MRILQICNKIPFPPKDGGALAMHQLSESLHRLGHSVKVLAMNTHKQHFAEADWTAEYTRKFSPEQVLVDTRIKTLHALFNLFSDRSYNIDRFDSEAFAAKLVEVLKANTYDIIQLESLYVAPYLPLIREHSNAKVVLRAHNIEHQIWERLATGGRNPLRKKYLRLLAERLKTYELNVLNDFDAVAAITAGDALFFRSNGCTKPVIHIPFGIEIKPRSRVAAVPGTLFFIGAMDWLPNLESVKWILEQLWPALREKFPELRFSIAGRNMPLWLKNLKKPGIEIFPDVPDADEFMADKAILLAPYFSGGGMRVKFIEAMTQGKVVISTALGAEGIEGRDGEHFLLAESRVGMLSVVEKCLRDGDFLQYIGANARSLVSDKYDSRRIAEKLTAAYQKISER